jgi:hypothetical protein
MEDYHGICVCLIENGYTVDIIDGENSVANLR